MSAAPNGASSATSSAEGEAPAAPATAPRGGSGAMFDRIAHRYDLLNRIISLGIDQSWRRATVDALRLGTGDRVLDLATGTADLALMIAERVPGTEIVGLDPSPRMLAIGRDKVGRARLGERITLVEGDAERLPFASASFHGVTMAFGIRNVPERERALAEMRRVLVPGRRVAILELSEPQGLLGPLTRFHVHHVVPRLGAWLSGASEYAYLQRSIAAFPPPERFADLMRDAGFEVEAVRRLSFGAAHLYVGRAPSA